MVQFTVQFIFVWLSGPLIIVLNFSWIKSIKVLSIISVHFTAMKMNSKYELHYKKGTKIRSNLSVIHILCERCFHYKVHSNTFIFYILQSYRLVKWAVSLAWQRTTEPEPNIQHKNKRKNFKYPCNGNSECCLFMVSLGAVLMLICLSFVRAVVDAIHLIKHFQLIY